MTLSPLLHSMATMTQPSKGLDWRSGDTTPAMACRGINRSFHFRSVYLGLPTPGFQRSVWSDDCVISVLLQIPAIELPCSQQVWDGIVKCWRQSVFEGDSLCAGGGATAGDYKADTHQQKIKSRYRQVRIGMQTQGFKRYIRSLDFGRDVLPIPDTSVPCSKRAWDSVLRHWRRSLHLYDDARPSLVAVARGPVSKRRHTPARRKVDQCASIASPTEMGFPMVQPMPTQPWWQTGDRRRFW